MNRKRACRLKPGDKVALKGVDGPTFLVGRAGTDSDGDVYVYYVTKHGDVLSRYIPRRLLKAL